MSCYSMLELPSQQQLCPFRQIIVQIAPRKRVLFAFFLSHFYSVSVVLFCCYVVTCFNGSRRNNWIIFWLPFFLLLPPSTPPSVVVCAAECWEKKGDNNVNSLKLRREKWDVLFCNKWRNQRLLLPFVPSLGPLFNKFSSSNGDGFSVLLCSWLGWVREWVIYLEGARCGRENFLCVRFRSILSLSFASWITREMWQRVRLMASHDNDIIINFSPFPQLCMKFHFAILFFCVEERKVVCCVSSSWFCNRYQSDDRARRGAESIAVILRNGRRRRKNIFWLSKISPTQTLSLSRSRRNKIFLHPLIIFLFNSPRKKDTTSALWPATNAKRGKQEMFQEKYEMKFSLTNNIKIFQENLILVLKEVECLFNCHAASSSRAAMSQQF